MGNKPRIRFKGFTEDWEQRKLGEIADITKLAGFEFTKYIVYSDKGNIIALRGLNIKDGDLNLEDVKYIDSSDFTKLKRSKLFRNDILFTYVGTIGEVARIQEADKYYLAPNVSRIRIKNRLLSEFLMYYMDRDLFYQKIIFPLIATSSQPALSMANIREFNITYPSDTNEQQKIALVFNRISHLITLHQCKLEKLKLTKKALLQKLFPKNGKHIPEIRFKGFTDAWEQRKFSDITYLSGIKNKENKPYESYSISNEFGFIPQDEQFENGGTMKTADKSMYYIVSQNSFAYNPARINVGSIGYYDRPDNVIVSSLYEVFKTTDIVNDKFLWHWFKSNQFNRLIEKYQEGGVRLYFYYDKLCKGTIELPAIKEQNKISNLLDYLDIYITLHQRKLERLQEVKKGLLQKMFV